MAAIPGPFFRALTCELCARTTYPVGRMIRMPLDASDLHRPSVKIKASREPCICPRSEKKTKLLTIRHARVAEDTEAKSPDRDILAGGKKGWEAKSAKSIGLLGVAGAVRFFRFVNLSKRLALRHVHG